MKKPILFLIAILSLMPFYAIYAHVTASQRQGLIDFYNAMDGDNWTDNTGWKTDGAFSAPGTEEDWFGIDLMSYGETDSSYVYWIRMPENNLTGVLSDTLFLPFRTMINYIYLDHNNLTGTIPDFRTYSRLDGIAFDAMPVQGALASNGEPLFPAGISVISLGNTLIEQNLTEVDWSGIPLLEVLELRNNQGITGSLTAGFCDLFRLSWAIIYNCNLTGEIPAEISQMYSLQKLSLGGNHLTGNIPVSLTDLYRLKDLDLSRNQLVGEIPAQITEMNGIINEGFYSGFDLNYNGLYTLDPAVADFINSRYGFDPDGSPYGNLTAFQMSQTLPPAQFSGWLDADRMIQLTWSVAPNSDYSTAPDNWLPGYYKIYHSTDLQNWTCIDSTLNKLVTNYSAPWLGTGLHNYFRIQTVTTPFTRNTNTLHSDIIECRVTDMIAFDDFEYPQSWLLSGDFAIGAPLAGANLCDTAHTPSKVLASNLSGNYLPSSPAEQSYAISPSYDCTGRQDIRLTFWSWSQFEGTSYDKGFVKLSINQGAWQTIETLDNQDETSWTKHWINLSPWADGQGDVRIMFTYYSDNATEFTGWNIDDIMIQSVPALSGIFSIDPNGITANNFTSFNAAIDLLNTAGISNDAYFEVSAGTVYTEELFPLQATGTAEHQIKFFKVNPGDNPVVISSGTALSSRDAILTLKGSDYVEFGGIDFQAASTDLEFGIVMQNRSSFDGCSYNSINNCSIVGVTNSGIKVVSDYQPDSANGSNSYNLFESNTLLNCANGILLQNSWSATGAFDLENVIRGCSFSGDGNFAGLTSGMVYGINASGQNGLIIESNLFSNLAGTITTAINHSGANGYIRSNTINNLFGNTLKGIVSTGAKIYNNMISLQLETPQDAVITGIELTNQYNSFVDFNTISVDGGFQSLSTCLVLPSTAAFRVSNNILSNNTASQGSPGLHSCVTASYANFYTSHANLCDANLYYLPSPGNGGVGYISSTQNLLANLADWQALTQQDFLSYTGNAHFVSTTDLHIRTDRPTRVESNGYYLQGVASYPWIMGDFDNESRHLVAPDLGADEGEFMVATEPPYMPYATYPQFNQPSIPPDHSPTVSWSYSMDVAHPVSWTELYFSTDAAAVSNLDAAALVQADYTTAYESWQAPAALQAGQTYFWQVLVCNYTGSTPGGIWSFTVDTVQTVFPWTEGFENFPLTGWTTQFNSSWEGGLNGNNLQPTMGMGWMQQQIPAYAHGGEGLMSINSFMMPALYWLVSPLFSLPSEAELSFWLHYDYTPESPTALHLVMQLNGTWNLLKSWDSAAEQNLYTSAETFSLAAYAGENVRFAFVYDVQAQGSEVRLDDVSLAGAAALSTPQAVLSTNPDGSLSLSWDAVSGASAYQIYSSAVPADYTSADWNLLSTVSAPQTVFIIANPAQNRFYYLKAISSRH